MGTCTYCHQPAGFLRSQHKACAQKYDQGWRRMITLAHQTARSDGTERPLLPALSEIAQDSYMTDQHVRNALVQGWLSAVDEFLDDHLLTEEEEQRLVAFENQYQLPMDVLRGIPGGDRIEKARALREVLESRIPSRPNDTGAEIFNFQKSEKLLWVFDGVDYYEDRTRRHYEGGHTGASVRVAKGLYWRVGAFKGRPVDTTHTVHVGTGTLAVTTKHIYFHSPAKAFRIRHDKIVSIQPYSDGIEVQRDAATAKPQKFITEDGWFLYNLVQNAIGLE